MSIDNDGQYNPEHQAPAGADATGQIYSPSLEPAPKKPRSPWIAVAIATAAVVCIGGLGTAAVAELTSVTKSATSSATQNNSTTFGRGGTFGQGNNGGFQGGGQSIGQQATAGEATAVPATSAQKVGIVTINTVLDYNKDEQAAGTGMILSSDGYILTNNHVIDGATSISVTVESTNKTYTATVVGSDSTGDVAVLKLAGASGLTPVTFASNESVTAGQSVYSVGNAEGTGNLVTAVGTVGAVNQSLTIGSDDSDATEHLTGMIELESDVVSGDSGGPLFDAKGRVIGMVTAASSGTNPVTGDAINIKQVLTIAKDIEAGTKTTTIQYGTPAFIGVNLSNTTSTAGVPVASTFPGMPAAKAGVVEGDIITAVNGVAVTTPTALSNAIHAHAVGSQVTLSWLDANGASHSATVTLVAGPAS